MTRFDIAHQRLRNQHLSAAPFTRPEDVVNWLCAVQAQDYAAAKWAVAQRTPGITDAAIDRAFAAGTILRTHVMRPTWHFVTPADIRWLLTLTAPRVNALNAYQYRNLGLDKAIFKRSNAALIKALQGGQQLTRAELVSVLQRAGITAVDLQFPYLMIRAELDGVVCSGARQGKQFTYALLDERAPEGRTLERDEALFELAARYFASRGPATLRDFVWWSGLTTIDARNALDRVKTQLLHEVIDDQTYWFPKSVLRAKDVSKTAFLLPNYDEYMVGYTDRSAVLDVALVRNLDARGNVLFNHTIVIDGRVAGIWKRTLKKDAVVIELKPFAPLTKVQKQAVAVAAQRYGAFLELSVLLE